MYLTHKYSIVQMMHVSGHKTQKTFMDYIKLSSDEIADEINATPMAVKRKYFNYYYSETATNQNINCNFEYGNK